MRPFFVLWLSLLLFLPRTPAQQFSEGMSILNSDSPVDESTLNNDDIFTTSSRLQHSQDLATSQDNHRVDFFTELGDGFDLDLTNAATQVMALDIPSISVADHETLESVCNLDSIEPAVKARQIIVPEWLSLSDWFSSPSEDNTKPGSDICIPPKQEEPKCQPGEETLCCTGKSSWVDDSMVIVVNGCTRCTSPVISVLPWHILLSS